MFEPSSPSQPEPSATPPPAPAPSSDGRALRLLAEVRTAQQNALWTQGLLVAVASLLVLVVAGGALASVEPRAGRYVLVAAPFVVLAVVLFFGVFLARRRVGDDERTARLLAEKLPGLNLDLLAAVELSRALGRHEDFSPDLARAFLRDVDARASRHPVATLIDQRPTRRAAAALMACLALVLGALVWKGALIRGGLLLAFTVKDEAGPARRQPITGDFELKYRYPAHTGLEPRTVAGSTGDVSAPAGTEVTIKTRADRDIEAAALVVNGARSPMRHEGRELSGSFVLDKSGQYHVIFLEGSSVAAEGPDLSITVEADQTPQVRITSPADGLELNPDKQQVTLKFEASDDYGLSTLELVYKPQGGAEQRVSLKPDEGRATRGQYLWEVGALKLKEGQSVTYHLEAKDNDAVSGPKKGVSNSLTLKLYSASEHRREALAKAEALWERLVTHLADRMESSDRKSPTPVDAAVAGKPVDERGAVLASDFSQLASDLSEERDAPDELVSALVNIQGELNRDVSAVASQRRFLLRLAGREGGGTGAKPAKGPPPEALAQDVGRRVASAIATDVEHSEKNVLYLESLLDRQKLQALKELARELKEDRRELSRLLEEYAKTKDPQVQEALFQQMQELRARMQELQQRMAELSKGIRDEFMNQEALQEMLEDYGFESSLDEVEKLIREGKTEEALKKMQELSMQMDEFLESLDEASDRADEQADPELARQFQEFQQNLQETIQQQESLSEKTKGLRDKYREQQKERIARQGEQLKKELKQKLDELDKSWKQLDGDRFGFRFDDVKAQAQQDLQHVGQSLEANDFDLASEAADKLEEKARQMADQAAEQRRLDEMFQNPPEVRRESKQLHDKLSRDAKKAEEVAQKLRDLFPQPGQQMNDQDKQQMQEMSRQQKQLQQKAQQLQQQMDQIGERAPIFNEDAQQQMEQAGQRMQSAGERLQGKDPSRGFGEQQGALQALKGLQQSMEQSGGGGKGGIPLPLKNRGRARSSRNEKVEIPDEDPNQAPREFRKDVMDAMKQGAPDRYRDQNKKYYEELVK